MLVSDTSTEAERLIASLRVRGFKVRDVPLSLLAGRVEAQRPKLVICDGQVSNVQEAISRMRQGAWGKAVELILLGAAPASLESLRSVVPDLDARVFARPIDVYSVIQRVEEVIGQADPAVRHGLRSMASLPRVGANGAGISSRVPTPVPRRNRASAPNLSGSKRSDPASAAFGEIAEPSAPRQASIAPPSEISSSDPAGRGVPVARMSEELEQLLQDADRRLATESVSMQPIPHASLRLSPEQELDAILPPDVLAALDDPVEIDEEDETSHPAVRHRDRTSAHAPDHLTALASNPVFSRPSVGTSALDEETPPGRLAGRLRASNVGNEGSNELFPGAVLTPVPPSVKTHHTHHTQANSTTGGQSSPNASSVEMFDPEPRSEAPPPRHNDSDSVAPGTNPELESQRSNAVPGGQTGTGHNTGASQAVQHDLARDVTSTAPPHPPRLSASTTTVRRESEDDLATVMRRERAEAASALEGAAAIRREREAASALESAAAIRREREAASVLESAAATRREREAASALEGAAATRREREAMPPPTVATRTPLERVEGALLATKALPGQPPKAPLSDGPALDGPARGITAVERDTAPPRSAAAGLPTGDARPNIEIPAAIGPGDVVRAFSRCVRSRYSGALALEDDSGIRRVVMREGDFVMVASGIEGESLIAFLIQRGDLDADAGRLARKLPQFGRHAGAALIAHGYLRQDELWSVLRAHAEWLLGRAMLVSQGSAGLETELSPRLSAEPAVFGGATGAEILIEVVRRVIPPEAAISAMGGPRVRVTRGASSRLLSECALAANEAQIVERAAGLPIGELLNQANAPDFASALYALVELGVLETMAASPEAAARANSEPPARDGLDDEAVRSRVALRRALVDEGDYFALLGTRRDATGYEVRHAYLALRREYDPGRLLSASTADLRDDVDLILEVLDEAYEILRDASRRERYRRALEAPPRTE